MIENSLIIKFIYNLFRVFGVWYDSSKFAALLGSFAKKLKLITESSSIVEFAVRDGVLSQAWKSSWLFLLMDNISNILTRLLRKPYVWAEKIFEQSYVYKLVVLLTKRYHIIASLFIFVILIFPDNRWYNIYATLIALCLLALFFIKTIINEDYSFNIKALDIFLIFFAFSVLLADVFSIFPGQSFRFLVFYINSFILLLLLVSSIKKTGELEQLLGVILMGVTLTGLYGVWQKIVGVPVNLSQIDITLNEGMGGRIYSTMGNPNNYAEVLVLFLPFYIAMILNARTLLKKLFFALLAVPPLLSLLFTLSRSSWIGFAVALALFVFLKNKKLLPLMILVGLMCIPLLPPTIYRRILTIWNPHDTSANYRLLIYETIKPMLGQYWFSGVGLGSDPFMKVVEKYYLYTKAIPPHSHNLLLQIWLETGILGVLAYIGYLIRLFKNSVKAVAKGQDRNAVNIVIAAISALAGIMVISLAEYVWFYHRVMILFWVTAGILMVALRLSLKESLDK